MNNRPFRSGPTPIASVVGNLLNPVHSDLIYPGFGFLVANNYLVIEHIRVVNRTATPVNVSLWIGGFGFSVPGTEFAWSKTPVPGTTLPPGDTDLENFLDWYGSLRLDYTDFVTGLAGAANALTIDFEGEAGITLDPAPD